MKQKNAWSGESYLIESSQLINIDTQSMELDVQIQERGKPPRSETVTVDMDAMPVSKSRVASSVQAPVRPEFLENLSPMDVVIRKLLRFCWIVDHPAVTGKLIQLGIQLNDDPEDDIKKPRGEIKENLYLNQVPHNRYVRQYFYDMAAQATLDAVIRCANSNATTVSNRMKIVSMFPEMNPSMDSYRIGTILEMVRAITIRLIEEGNLRVRVCVQGSMGVGIFTGVPKQLNGVAKLLQMMDWQSKEGEINEGMVGDYLNFGAIGKEHVVDEHINEEDGSTVHQDDVFLLIAPQSMVGIESSIIRPLEEMVEAAGDRPVILINADLEDKISSQGQQSVRGRQQRMDFANSFETIYHFQNIYISGTSYFPILGCMTKMSPTAPWVAHQRRDLMNNEGEVYVPMLAGEERPDSEAILKAFQA